MSEYDPRQDIYFKDASDSVKRFIKSYWQIKLGVDLPVSDFEVIFGDETHSWEDFKAYGEIKEHDENVTIDTADREIINGWLWARVQGETFPQMLDEEDMEGFIAKLKDSDLLNTLYKRRDVYAADMNRVQFSKDVRLTSFVLPETLTISGDIRVVNAAIKLIEENMQALVDKIAAQHNAE
tara:strand:+ start:3333 stop:3875 length:543 start_codon:yes stop_codon:yes gene_type:complete